MNVTSKSRLEERIRLAQQWKISGLTQVEFARQKGIEIGDLRYKIRYVREKAPESLTDSIPEDSQFVPVPPELLHDPEGSVKPLFGPSAHPVLTIQSGSVSLSASNQVDLTLLRSALEVILHAE